MQSEIRPTAKQLIASWMRIWQQKLSGTPTELKDAIRSHAQLFPKGNQAEAHSRTLRTVESVGSDADHVRALLRRGQNTLRNS